MPLWTFRSALGLFPVVLAVLALPACGRSMLWPTPEDPVTPEVCGNGLDDDGDGFIDCQDPECKGQPGCGSQSEVCDNQLDDDSDGLIDCNDPECFTASNCQSHPEICGNGLDDDGDGLIDCSDPQCFNDPGCDQPREICGNGLDDDKDGRVDCADPDCAGTPLCQPGKELCSNKLDDDRDGLIDCLDPDCTSDPICQSRNELCGNGLDDDSDGLVDCMDPDCSLEPACQPGKEICNNYLDDDSDGLIDCYDPDCYSNPVCKPGQEICGNKLDDDNDGLIDCYDPDCASDPTCGPKTEICNNNTDDDGNGLIDCKDPACLLEPYCLPKTEICDNGIDDDANGKVDCEDPACKALPMCAAKIEDCTNKTDDDGDGFIDCKDPDCFKHPECKEPGKEICNNGIDDDEDGQIDCKDSDCALLPICKPGTEICNNKKDDDGDGAVDCDDPDCKTLPACLGEVCKPTVSFGTIQPKGSTSTQTLSNAGTKDIYLSTCAVPGGGEVVAQLTLTGKTDLKLDYEQLSGDHVLSLYRAGLAEACNANPRGCFDPKSAKTGSFSIKSLDAGTYYLMAEAFAKGLEGKIKVTLSTGPAVSKETCNNGIDDDGDLAIDCADLDCILTAGCQTQLCKADINLGSLVIDGPSKNANVNVATAQDLYDETCSAGGGKEKIIRFVMPAAGGVSVTVSQQNWHVLGMHSDLGPGTSCLADKGSCFDTNGEPGFTLVYDDVEKGAYFYVVEALKPGTEGFVNLEFSAFSNRGPELCANKVDDDGDGLVDCMDPDCTGVVGCPGPVCTPDLKTGPLAPGAAPVSLNINTKTANNDQTVSCALGGGKDVVIEIELTKVSGLGISCKQTGDHVFGLFTEGAPRDPCDKYAANCADPSVGPLSCNFIMPNLQPGRYYLVVEAFKPGAEGVVDLQLMATPDHAQEICNNNIDDDGDGKIDCYDSNCSSLPICQGKSCTPDQKLGILPAGGTPVSAAATILGGTDKVATSCASGGGADAVYGFSLINPASVTVEYAQFGNHVFGLFVNKGSGYACDAAPKTCTPTSGQTMGKATFSSLAAGEYYLVVEAVNAASEGSVVMKISAQ